MQDSIELKNVIEYYKDKAVMIMSLQDNLKLLRMKLGYKQAKDFAKFAGIPYSSYSAYERGSWPNEENLIKLARALNVSIDTLIGYTPKKVDKFAKAVALLKESGYEVQKEEDTPDCYFVTDPKDPMFLAWKKLEKWGIFAGQRIYKQELIEIANSIDLSPEVKEGYYNAFKSAFRKNAIKKAQEYATAHKTTPESLEKKGKEREAYMKAHSEEEKDKEFVRDMHELFEAYNSRK